MGGPKPVYPVPPEGYAAEKPAGVYRSAKYAEPPTSLKGYEDCKTVPALFKALVKAYKDRPAVATRPTLHQEKTPDGFEKLTMGKYEKKTYGQFSGEVDAFGKGIVEFADLSKGSVITIFADTKEEWMTACLATLGAGCTVATVYATLGAEGAAHAINQTSSTVVVADAKLLKVLVDAVKLCPLLKYVVAIGNVPEDLVSKVAASGLVVKTAKGLIAEGGSLPALQVSVSPEDLAIIMYTSGTTGVPKGVMLSHRNIIAGIVALQGTVDAAGITPDTPDSCMVGYLPLAHIMEITVELTIFSVGGYICYGSVATLTDTSAKILNCKGDLTEAKPNIFLAAPAVLDKVRVGLLTKMANGSKIIGTLFNMGFAAAQKRRTANASRGFVGSPPFWNKILFKKVQALLGGRVKMIGCGSAPLSPDTQEFCEIVFNCPVSNGYALTETCCAGTFCSLADRRSGVVGGPMPSAMLKLVDWPEGNYFVKDKENPAIGKARGEIYIGGPSVSSGYFQKPGAPDPELAEKNKTEFDTDANGWKWFHTGDIGEVGADGVISIIDRKKDLLKLSQGEYVSLSKVECALKACLYIDQVMAYGKGTKDHCMAIIVPNMNALKKWAGSHGKGDLSPEALCKDKDAIAEVSKGCAAACKDAKLNKMETPKTYLLSSVVWTPENELLTAAQKMKRPVIVESLRKEIDAVY